MSDLTDEVDQNTQDIQDLSDNTDASVSDISDNLDQVSENLDDLNNNEGQLMFPLTQDTIDLITEIAPNILTAYSQQGYIGQATLVAGTITINSNLIDADAIVFLSVASIGGTAGTLSYVASTGSIVINSSSVTDTSLINYFIINPNAV